MQNGTVASARLVLMAQLLLALCGPAAQVASAEAAAEPKKPCSTAPYRQFDFWRGNWVVTENGKPAGKNRIEAVLNGCALLESWTGVGGLTGHSLNTYDATRDVWHQTWVDSAGSLLTLEGHLQGNAMVLEGLAVEKKDTPPTHQRITWTPRPNGDVRQHWQSSADDGLTWKTEFDGLYKRAE